MRMESVGKPMTSKLPADSVVEGVGNSNEDKDEFAVAAEDVVYSYENVTFLNCSNVNSDMLLPFFCTYMHIQI